MKHSSQLHRKVGSILDNLYQGVFTIYQELSVKDIDSTWPDYRSKFDWVILEPRIVIECHGRQHYHKHAFSSTASTSERLASSIASDAAKFDAADKNGFTYVEISYDMKNADIERTIADAVRKRASSTTRGLQCRNVKKTKSEYKERARTVRREFMRRCREEFRKRQRNG